jgi:DNA-binding MarR family transcriptional regulator
MSNPQLTEPITHDHELDVLTQLHQNTGVKQRDLAQAIGLSLGMTNAILKRLAGKGFVAMRRINARNIHYLVTPEGIDLIARRSYRYLRRTVGHVVRYKERMIEILLAAAAPPPAGRGITSVHLVGQTDLEFLVEWCAEKAGLHFSHQTDVDSPPTGAQPDAFVVAGEAVPRKTRPEDEPWDLHLAELVIGGPRRGQG